MAFVEVGPELAKPGTDLQFYPAFGNRVPGLRSFYLSFDPFDASPGDYEINRIQVLVGGQSEDLAPPGAQGSPENIPDGKLWVNLQDTNPGHKEFQYNVSHSLLDIPGARRFQYRAIGEVGEGIQTLPIPSSGIGLPDPSIIALVGFRLFFILDAHHHLDRVGVWFRGNDLHVALQDKNADDAYGYLVDFVVIPTDNLNVSSGIHRGTFSGGGRISIPSPSHTDFVLTGWAFNFVGDGVDHEIRDLGVLRDWPSSDDVTFIYSDKDGDDLFDWRLEWAHLGQKVVAPI